MAAAATQTGSKTARLERYLRAEVSKGEQYFKSRFIAEDLDLSSREIGAAFLKLSETNGGVAVEKWAEAGGTTWKVTLADDR
jgi:hypothetical protein